MRRNGSPSKNINKTYKEMNGKRAQSTDKGYKRGSSSIQAATAAKNNMSQQNNTINQSTLVSKTSRKQAAEQTLSLQSNNTSFATMQIETTQSTNKQTTQKSASQQPNQYKREPKN